MQKNSRSLCLPKPRTNNMKKSFMYEWAHLYQKKLGKTSHFLPFETKSMLIYYQCVKTCSHLPVNNLKLFYVLKLISIS